MKKLLISLLAILIVTAFFAQTQAKTKNKALNATIASHHFNQGPNLMSFPEKPKNPSPKAVFAGLPISKNLIRYHHPSQNYVIYDEKAPRDFGAIKVGEGYWFNCLSATGCDVSYNYLPNTDYGFLKIDLPSPGWYLVGASDIDVPFENILVKKGHRIKKFSDAADLWIQDPLLGYDSENLKYFSAGLKGTDNDHFLRSWHGYWLYSFEYNLKLIIPTSQISAHK